MYEDKAKEKGGTHISEKDRVLAWTKDVAESTAKEAPHLTSQRRTPEARHIESEPPKVIVNQIVTTPAVIVTRARPDPAPRDEISTKAVIGTVLGATAGAVVAYAMTKSQTEKSHVEQPERISHRIIEAPISYELVQRDNESHVREYTRASSKSSHHAFATQPLPHSQNGNLIPRSEHSHHPSRSVTQSHIEGLAKPPYVTKISIASSGDSRTPHASFHERTARQSDLIPITEARSARDVPLPESRVTSLATEDRAGSRADQSTVSPKESVSQAGTRRSGRSGRSDRPSTHNGGTGKDHESGDHRSRISRK